MQAKSTVQKRGHNLTLWLDDAEHELHAAQRSALRELTPGAAARILRRRALFPPSKKAKL